MRYLQGVQGGNKAPTRGTRWVQGTYKAYEARTRQLQGVQGGYKTPTSHMRQV